MLQTFRTRWKLALGLTFLGVFASIFLIVAGAAGLAWTSTEEFCISCHEMKNNVYAEFKGTIHDQNRTGVRAICPDCHVPRAVGPLLLRKVQATMELYGHFITHKIDTKEKFEANRHELATRVWTRMKSTDSLECRNCHKFNGMSHELQSPKAQKQHAKMATEKVTCIDCHFGIAHTEPAGPGPDAIKIN